jgi:nitrite reductase/ring-hydroxylating ferredoxin subunit
MTDKINGKPVPVIPAEDYASASFAALEYERMWPKTWQVACRVEELPRVGDQLVYENCDDSIIVMRTSEDRICAFYNACPHRGRQLVTGPRRTQQLVCPFHGWRFDLNGRCTHIPYKEDWGPGLDEVDHDLTSVGCDTWGGFVFVNLDPKAGPLRTYLGEAAVNLDPFEYQRQRIRWTASVEVNANWKLTLEAFIEAYHIQTTHPQLTPVFDDRTQTFGAGLHGYMLSKYVFGAVSPLIKTPQSPDIRLRILEFMRQQAFDVGSVFAERDVTAASRMLTELSPDVSPEEAGMAVHRYRREAAIAAGVGWPEMTQEQMMKGGVVWHIFPNLVCLTGPTASLWYRVRPVVGAGKDPERCILDFIALERYAEGYAPNPVHQHYDNWKAFKSLPSFLAQDFANLPHLQKGVRSRGFKGALVNPVQEEIIVNFHSQLRRMVGADDVYSSRTR